jgi:hypothetical protein
MRQVMPHRSNIVADPDNCKSLLHKNAVRNHSSGLTSDRLLQLASAQILRLRRFAFSHRRFKRDQATGKAGVKLAYGGNTADNRRERQ